MNAGVCGLALLLVCVSLRLGHACIADGRTLICEEIPSTFSPGYLSLVILMKNVGEINSTVLHSDNLASITRLTINGANVTGIVPGAFASFQNLQNLSLKDNALTQINAAWFGQPTVLKDLNLMENQIEVLEESMLSGFTGLTGLNLSKNRIRSIKSSSFRLQTNLLHLDLSGNRLTRVTPQVFGFLRSTRIRLDGNPWDCSCGVEDFVDFLKDLQSNSLLDREMEVTCTSPLSLSGEPVWNVSVCVTTPSSPTSSPPSSPTSSLPSSPPETEASVHPKPTDIPITTPTVIGLIVSLCVLLCVVCFLGVLYRKKRGSKTVKPGPLIEEEKLEEDGRIRTGSPKTPGAPEKRGCVETIHWDPERAWRYPITGVRAKSANAVLATSPFCGAVKHSSALQTKIEGPSEDIEDLDETKNKELEFEAEEVGKSQAENVNLPTEAIDKHDDGTGRGQHADTNIPYVPVSTETVPYFSIGTDPSKPNPDLNRGQRPDSPDHKSQMVKVIGRVSTWPPTSVQWQLRCNNRAQKEGPSIFTIHIPSPEELRNYGNLVGVPNSSTAEVLPLEGGKGDTAEDIHIIDSVLQEINDVPIQSRQSQSCLVTSETVYQQTVTTTDDIFSKPNDPSSSEAHSERQTQDQSDLSLNEALDDNAEEATMQNPDTTAQCTIDQTQTELKNQIENRAHFCQDSRLEGTRGITEDFATQDTATNNRGELINKLNRAQTKGEGSSITQSRNQNGAESKAAPGGVSPGDRLSNDEYSYVDLLHEVVQNHGRWTRERWRQTHLSKQHHKQQGQGH